MLLTCHHSDVEVGGYSFPFWSRLSTELTVRYPLSADSQVQQQQPVFTSANSQMPSGQHMHESSAAVAPHLAPFVPYYRSLVDCIVRSLAYPLTLFIGTRPARRAQAISLLSPLTRSSTRWRCLGVHDTLQRLWQHTQPALTSYTSSNRAEWQSLEAVMHAFPRCGRRVPYSEQNVMPAVLSLVSAPVPGLVSSHSPHLLAYTCVLLIGRYSDWVNNNLSFLPQLLACIVSALNWSSITHCH